MKRIAIDLTIAIVAFFFGAATLRAIENHYHREWMAQMEERRRKTYGNDYYRYSRPRKR